MHEDEEDADEPDEGVESAATLPHADVHGDAKHNAFPPNTRNKYSLFFFHYCTGVGDAGAGRLPTHAPTDFSGKECWAQC